MNTVQSRRSSQVVAIAAAVSLGVVVAGQAEAALLSHVTDEVVQNGAVWDYSFTVFNDDIGPGGGEWIVNDSQARGDGRHIIIDWELPWFDDMGITDIRSPDGWRWAIETIGTSNASTGWDGVAAWQDPNDPWYRLLDGANNPIFSATQVLHWYCDNPMDGDGGIFCVTGEGEDGNGSWGSAIDPGEWLSGFGFVADYDAVQAPYQTSWMTREVNTGDPAFPGAGGVTVGSPNALGTVTVPEPGSIALMSLGLMGLAGAGYRRRRSQDKQQ